MESALSLSHSPIFMLEAFTYAFLAGLFPALIWLWFWMHEGHEHHEPKGTIWLTFVAGMCCVFFVYIPQQLILSLTQAAESSWIIVFLWAACEEIFKFGAAYIFALRDKGGVFDEPIDAFVYLMTAALGFSAMENTFALLQPVLQGNFVVGILTNNLRFMGANLLHVASSGVFSIFIALAFYKTKWVGRLYTYAGLLLAVLLHGVFNFLIILVTEVGKENIFIAFSFVWLTIIILILALERVKTIKEF
jgi:RsiW-degrading membrane proteinase PrsW (M82 family)